MIIAVNNNLLTKYGYGTYASTGEAFPLAIVGIVMKVFGIVVSIVIGISLGGQPIIGFNMGAGNTERVKETIQLITKLVLLVGIIAFLIFELAPDAVWKPQYGRIYGICKTVYPYFPWRNHTYLLYQISSNYPSIYGQQSEIHNTGIAA